MVKWLIFAIAGLGIAGLCKIGETTIDTMGSLVHFNCRPTANRVVCALTHEPLIGQLHTIEFEKQSLKMTKIQQGRRATDQRLAIVLQSGEEVPLTHNWSTSNNRQLFQQRELLDRFIADTTATTLNVRTHRPGQLWIILVGLLAGIGGFVAIALKLSEG
jgi:hypothetical protein